MSTASQLGSLTEALQRYFDLHYTADTRLFDRVFRASAQLHGFREGALKVWTAAAYRAALESRLSPERQGAPRQEEILMIDVVSPHQALAKVRLRVGSITYVDHLSYHRERGEWLITAKAFHVESVEG